jgi:phosphatidate phosphatase APP1
VRSIHHSTDPSSLQPYAFIVAPQLFRRAAGHPHHKQSFFRYLFPHPRQTARDRLTKFRFETLPYYKLRAQSRIYNYIVNSQRRRKEKRATGTSVIDILRRRGRRLLGTGSKDNAQQALGKVSPTSSSMSSYSGDGYGEARERGGRRKKLAGYLKAANDLRQSYQQSYSEKWGAQNHGVDDDPLGLPGAFPDVAIVSHGDEQMILFPSYARRHTKEKPYIENPDLNPRLDGPGDAEYWAREWQKFEDDRAIVDVDVRGWLYSPHRGPMTRKNRLLIGLARQLSGVPAPKSNSRNSSPESNSLRAKHREHEEKRDEERIAKEAEEILKRGQGEEYAAVRGDYSEKPKPDSDGESMYSERGRRFDHSSRTSPDNSPVPGRLSKRTSWNQPSEMTQAELFTANTHLMTRIKPFLTNPMVSTPVTVFFYDEKTSVSRTITTNEAGHFVMRASLEFVPTHVRVLASENLSAIEEVKITEPKGVSLISDVDDTIKHSSIGAGAREIFRNAFIRDLGDLTIDGVREWYNTMYDMGVGVHYVSNSPWQLFPVLVSFFRKAGLPPGSYHLKQYSGMLQGIFEPVAERKKGTLEKIMRDFPERKFILIGDSGEADLEVYTDVVLANPGKILGIFIRDVTTPPDQGFFDSAMGPLSGERRRQDTSGSRAQSIDSRRSSTMSRTDLSERPPALPPRVPSETKPQTSSGPAMGTLIDFGDEPEEPRVHQPHHHVMPRSMSDVEPLALRRRSAPDGKPAPPRPSKPMALRGTSTITVVPAEENETASRNSPPPPPKPRRSGAVHKDVHPLKQSQNSADMSKAEESYLSSARNKVTDAYNHLPEVRSYIPGMTEVQTSPKSMDGPPPPPRRKSTIPSSTSTMNRLSWTNTTSTNNSNSPDSSDDDYRPSNGAPANKKLDLWKRRWKRAKDILDGQGVELRAWRTGGDVCIEAVHMVEQAMRDMNVEGYGNSKGKTGHGGGEVKVKDLKR